MSQTRLSVGIIGILLLSSPFSAAGQAWVPERGVGTATLAVQDNFIRDHLSSHGDRVDAGHIRTLILVQDVDYGITDKLAANLSLPFVLSKYYGFGKTFQPHQLPVDNGNYHGNFQDIRLNLRYNLRASPLMMTPFVGLGVPTNDYIYFAHSAAGVRMREYVLGSSFGGGFGPLLPRMYAQGTYSFVIPQRVIGIRPYRSRMDWEVGYFLSKRFAVRTLGNLQIGHSGLGLPEDFPRQTRTLTDTNWIHHDQTTKVSYLNLGGGASFAVSKSWSGFLALTTTVWGRNGHALSLGEMFGVSRTFHLPWERTQSAFAELTAGTPSGAKGTQIPQHVH